MCLFLSGFRSVVPLIFIVFSFAIFGCSENPSEPGVEEESPNVMADTSVWRVKGRHLYDPCGEKVILRGINKMIYYNDRDGIPSYAEIAKTGANVVRIFWFARNDHTPAELDLTLTNAVSAGLLPIIELHDATGNWEGLEALVDYWVRPSTVDVIRKHQSHLIVNIGNEVGTHAVTDDQYKEGYSEAIRRMREAGIRTPLMIDAAGWGRNVEQLLRTAPYLMEQDPESNLLFSWHSWDTGEQQKARVTNAFEQAVAAGIPLVVGEFAHTEVGCRGRFPYEHLLDEAQRLEIGWLAWSWGPGNGDCPEMDMTEDGTFDTLHDWGLEVAVTHPHSIKNTAVRPHSITNGACRP